MRRPLFPSQRETSRRPNGVRSSSPSSAGISAAADTASAWVRPRLLNATTQLLALQPDDPFRVLSAHFSTEALLLGAYPEPSSTVAATDEKELEEEAVVAASLRSSPCPTRPAGKSVNGSAAKGKAPVGRGDSRPTSAVGAPQVLEYLVEHSWARRLLQPYGLHAVTRSVCPSSGSILDPPAAESNAVPHRTAEQQQQWMECFALLHRQSRLSSSEKVMASRRAVQINGAVLPPVDYRATEEVSASLVLLYIMCVIEEHIRRVDWGPMTTDGAPHSAFAFRRLQLSVKLLGLQLLVAFMKRQEQDRSDKCSSTTSSSSGDGEDALMGAVDDADPDDALSDVAGPCASFLAPLYALPPDELEQFHCWFLQRLRAVSMNSASIVHDKMVPQNSSAVNTEARVSAASDEPSALPQLQSHVLGSLRTILNSDSCAAPETPAVISVDTFVSIMQCVAPVLVSHQCTATSMAVTLSARVRRGACIAGAHRTETLKWATTLLQRCTAHLINAVPAHAHAVQMHPPPLPYVWKAYVEQIANALHHLQHDAVNGENRNRVRPALSKVFDEVGSDEDVYVSVFAHAFGDVPNCVVMEALVGEWVSRVFEACISV